MSFRLTDRAFKIKGLDLRLKFTLAYLCHRANDDGKKCWPNQENIANRTGVSVRQARRNLKKLATAGWIEIRPRYLENRRGRTSDAYVINLEKLPKPDQESTPKDIPDTQMSAKRGITGHDERFTGHSKAALPDTQMSGERSVKDQTKRGAQSRESVDNSRGARKSNQKTERGDPELAKRNIAKMREILGKSKPK